MRSYGITGGTAFGIRRGLGFKLYNVEGLDAVEVHMKSSDVRRIGTDDPQGLALR